MADTPRPGLLSIDKAPESKSMADIVDDASPASESSSFDRSQDDVKGSLSGIIRPLQWPSWIKHLVLFQIVAHASMASWCASALIPAFFPMSKVFRYPISDMTYLVGSYTLMMGFGVLFWNPLADKIGRRPVLLISTLVAIAATCGTAKAPTYGTMMVARIFQGFGTCAPCTLGAEYIKDMYQAKDRGKALGVWTLGLTTGPFLAPFISGFIVSHTTFVWVFWLEALLLASLFLFELVFLPESMISAPCYRNVSGFRDIVVQLPKTSAGESGDQSLTNIMLGDGKYNSASESLKMTCKVVGYPAAWLCGLGFSVSYGYIVVATSSLFPTVYGIQYRFTPEIQGVLYLPMLIGSILAELITGRMGDWAVAHPHRCSAGKWVAKRNAKGGKVDGRAPEMRLIIGMFGVILSIAGLLWFGVAVKKHLHWANPAIATGLAAFGSQMVTSICFSYVIDIYPKSAKEVATVMNMFRVLSSFVVLFYNEHLNIAVGYALSFGIQAIISAVFGLGGLGLLVVCGGRWRRWSAKF